MKPRKDPNDLVCSVYSEDIALGKVDREKLSTPSKKENQGSNQPIRSDEEKKEQKIILYPSPPADAFEKENQGSNQPIRSDEEKKEQKIILYPSTPADAFEKENQGSNQPIRSDEEKKEQKIILINPFDQAKRIIPQKFEVNIFNLQQYLTEEGKIDLDHYVNITIDKYKNEIFEARTQLGYKAKQLRFNAEPITIEKVGKLKINEIASEKGRQKYFWYGLVYKITMINPETGQELKSLAGMTKDTLETRWKNYVFSALYKDDVIDKGIYGDIDTILSDYGWENLKHREGKIEFWKVLKVLDPWFKKQVVRICFDYNSLRKAEDDYIMKNNLITDGYNINRGGGGGEKIDLPMIFIAKLIALLKTHREIVDLLNNKFDIRVAISTLSYKINSYWNSTNEARERFLKPILENLIKSDFQLYEINEAYNRLMFDFIRTFFGGFTFQELKEKTDENWSNLPVLSDKDKFSNAGKVRDMIPGKILESVILTNLEGSSASRDQRIMKYVRKYSEGYLIAFMHRQIRQQLGYKDYKNARLYIVARFIIQEIRKNSTGFEIFNYIGYGESVSKNQFNILCSNIFDGMYLEELHDFFEKHTSIKTLYDFKRIKRTIFSEKVDSISKNDLDDILMRHIDAQEAAKEIPYLTTGGLKNIVKTYYPNWREGLIEVKLPFILKCLKNKVDLKKICTDVGYSKNIIPSKCKQILEKYHVDIKGIIEKKYPKFYPKRQFWVLAKKIILERQREFEVGSSSHLNSLEFANLLGSKTTYSRSASKYIKDHFDGLNFLELKNFIINGVLPERLNHKLSYFRNCIK